MTLIVRLREEADRDLSEAASWYEGQQPGPGHEFLDQVSATLAAIGENPGSYPVVHRNTYRALLGRFPFAVFYRLFEQEVVVLAEMHASRHPASWQVRS